MKLSDKAREIISAIAPVLGASLGGPLGGLAGNLLATKLGVKPEDPKAMEAAVLALSPESVAQVRLAEIELEKHAKDNEIDLERINSEDRDSARRREIAIKDRTPAVLAYAVTLGFFGTLAFLLVHGKPETGGDALLVMLGSLGTAWAGITSYYFGSSAGSKDKNSAIAAAMKR